jgi:hypothetical protein
MRGMKWSHWSVCAKYVVLGSTESGGDKQLLNNFRMPKRELYIFCFPNFQTPPGYDHYHSERTINKLFHHHHFACCPGLSLFPTSHILFHCSCSLCLSSALLTIISDSFHELLVCLSFPSLLLPPFPSSFTPLYRSLPSSSYSFF